MACSGIGAVSLQDEIIRLRKENQKLIEENNKLRLKQMTDDELINAIDNCCGEYFNEYTEQLKNEIAKRLNITNNKNTLD